MEVSMRALAMLTGYAFLFGVALGALYALFACLASLFLPGETDRPIPWDKLPRRAARFRPRRIHPLGTRLLCVLRFFGDAGFFLMAGILFSVFLYCFNDGIPRFVVLLSAFAGFLLFLRYPGALARRIFSFLLLWLRFFLLFALAVTVLPVLDLLLGAGRKILSFFGIFSLLIKKRCAIIIMKSKRERYMRREVAFLRPSAIYEKIPH